MRSLNATSAEKPGGMELYNAGIYATNSFDCEALCKRSEELEKEHED